MPSDTCPAPGPFSHPAHASFASFLAGKLQNRAKKDQRLRPQVLEMKGLNYLLLLCTGVYEEASEGVLPVS